MPPTIVDPNRPVPDTLLVAMSPEILVGLAAHESEPLAIVGVQPHASIEGAFELILRRPSRQELQAAIMARFQAEDRSRIR